MRIARLSTLSLSIATAAVVAGCSTVAPTPPSQSFTVFLAPTHWQALSRTATGVTGDITLSNAKLTFANQASISLEPIDQDTSTGQTLFRVTSRANPELLNGNLLCGDKRVDYLVVQSSDDVPGQSDLQLMAYYYPGPLQLSDLPLRDKDDINRQMCALYTYVGIDGKPMKAP